MSETKDQGMATLQARLAGQEMLGFQGAGGVNASSTTKLGVLKPPPPVIANARG